MTATFNPIFCVTPPYLLEKVLECGSPKQKKRAFKALTMSAQFRGRRQALVSISFSVRRTVQAVKHRFVYNAGSKENIRGKLARKEGEGPAGDPAVDEAYDGAGKTWDFYYDVFGSLVKQRILNQTASEADWPIGQGLFTSNVNGQAIRSMKSAGTAYDDPLLGKDPQPGHMKEYIDTTSDNGGVHLNSGIPSRAFCICANEIGGYAWDKAGKIWYKALCDSLKPDCSFREAGEF